MYGDNERIRVFNTLHGNNIYNAYGSRNKVSNRLREETNEIHR